MATALNVLGLVLDIVAALLLWKFGLPADVRRSGASFLRMEGEPDPAEVAKAKTYDHVSKLGIALLALGFVLQLAGEVAGR